MTIHPIFVLTWQILWLFLDVEVPLVVNSESRSVGNSNIFRNLRVIEDTPKVNVLFLKLEVRKDNLTHEVYIVNVRMFLVGDG